MLTQIEVEEIVDEIEFRDWDYVILRDDDRLILQIQFDAPDNFASGVIERQYCRKWFLSPHMTVSEIVATAFKATLAAVEHEAREEFKFKGVAAYNPHTDIYALMDAATRIDIRA